MTKTIDTLIEDVEAVLKNGVAEVPDEIARRFAENMYELAKSRLKTYERKPTLRMSNIGSPCVRKLHQQINRPEEAEELSADTKLKFLYGDVVEEMMLFLAELAGHSVEGRQSIQEISGIKGHRDAVIDGTLVDVKSTSSFSYKKFKDGDLASDDPFGYRVQLQSYLHASQDDDVVVDKSRAAFWAVDKTLGHQCLDFHDKQDYDFETAYETRKEIVNDAENRPDRAFELEEDGYKKKEKDGSYTFVANGNMKLGMFCSYCDMKHACYDGKIRTFLGTRAPLHLVEVVKEPRMIEVDRYGNKIEKE